MIPANLVDAIRKIPGKKFAEPNNAAFTGDFHWYRLNGAGTVANPWNWSHKRGRRRRPTRMPGAVR